MENTAILFDRNTFSSLSLKEFGFDFGAIGIEDLSETEQGLVGVFLTYIEPALIGELDSEQLFWVNASEGIFQRIISPTIKSDGKDGLVLQVGANRFRVEAEDKELKVGSLFGNIAFGDTKKKTIKKEGKDVEIEYQPGHIDFMTEGDTRIWRVECRFNLDQNPLPSLIRKAEREGNITTLSNFFVVAGERGEGSPILKMQDLGEGEFLLTSVRKLSTEFGERYILQLADGRECWSRSQVESVFASGWQFPSDQPVTLAVSNIRKSRDNKTFLDCALRLREPKTAEKPITQAVQTSKPRFNKPEQIAAEKLLAVKSARSAVATIVPPDTEIDLDDMPF